MCGTLLSYQMEEMQLGANGFSSDAEGKVERYKARLVAQGFAQRHGQDYDETFCPVVRFESVRTVIALAAKYGLKLHQMDITTAFLNGDLKESIYMKQPEGYAVKGKEKLVCKLKESLYGLKQPPRCWNEALDKHLKRWALRKQTVTHVFTLLQEENFS